MTCYERFHWSPTDVCGLNLQEAEQLAIYFEEVLHHEKLENHKLRQQSGGSESGSIGDGYAEEYAFEDTSVNPHYTDPYDD